MKVGDLVRFRDMIGHGTDRYVPIVGDIVYTNMVGIVLDVNHWTDSGAPDRNFGTDVKVLWADGSKSTYDPMELEPVND